MLKHLILRGESEKMIRSRILGTKHKGNYKDMYHKPVSWKQEMGDYEDWSNDFG